MLNFSIFWKKIKIIYCFFFKKIVISKKILKAFLLKKILKRSKKTSEEFYQMENKQKKRDIKKVIVQRVPKLISKRKKVEKYSKINE